jgi:hypothetical protein
MFKSLSGFGAMVRRCDQLVPSSVDWCGWIRRIPDVGTPPELVAGERMNVELATVAIGCLILLTVVGVILPPILNGRYLPVLLGSAGAERENLPGLS